MGIEITGVQVESEAMLLAQCLKEIIFPIRFIDHTSNTIIDTFDESKKKKKKLRK